MTILVTIEVRGDTADLLSKYDQALPTISEAGPKAGLLLHLCTPTEDGFAMTEVWGSREQMLGYVRDTLEPLMSGLGVPEPEVTVRPVRGAVSAARPTPVPA